MTAMDVIELKGVGLERGGQTILREVNLSVAHGDFVAMVGPNGGGKTTLLKLMLGLLSPSRGTVRLLGLPPAAVRSRVGYMPQYSNLDPGFPLAVEEAVLMGRLAPGKGLGFWRREDKDAAAHALEQVGLVEMLRRPLAQLSGGQRQRVLVARALVGAPEILLLDEPTSNADVRSEHEFYDLLQRLNQTMTIVVVTHDLGFVSPYIQHVACVNKDVLFHPTSEVTGEVISAVYGGPVSMVRHDHHNHKDGGCFDG